MLVGPRGVTACPMDNAKDGVGADKVPGVNRSATRFGIARKALRIDRSDATVGQARTRCAAVQLALVQINALFVFGAGARGRCTRRAWAGSHSIARGLCRRVQ